MNVTVNAQHLTETVAGVLDDDLFGTGQHGPAEVLTTILLPAHMAHSPLLSHGSQLPMPLSTADFPDTVVPMNAIATEARQPRYDNQAKHNGSWPSIAKW